MSFTDSQMIQLISPSNPVCFSSFWSFPMRCIRLLWPTSRGQRSGSSWTCVGQKFQRFVLMVALISNQSNQSKHIWAYLIVIHKTELII